MHASQARPVRSLGWTALGRRPRARRAILVGGNVAGAALAAYLLWPNLQFFLQTHRPIGLVFAIQQAWVAAVFLLRRAPRTVSRRPLDWVAAYAGWFTGFLVRPGGAHPTWGVTLGFWVQVAGLLFWTWAFARLARSYGIVATVESTRPRMPSRARSMKERFSSLTRCSLLRRPKRPSQR